MLPTWRQEFPFCLGFFSPFCGAQARVWMDGQMVRRTLGQLYVEIILSFDNINTAPALPLCFYIL